MASKEKGARAVAGTSKGTGDEEAGPMTEPSAKLKKQWIMPLAHADTGSLFYLIVEEKMPVKDVAYTWCEQYLDNQKDATILLMQFVIQSCGWNAKISEAVNLEMSSADIINNLTEGILAHKEETNSLMTLKDNNSFVPVVSKFFFELTLQIHRQGSLTDGYLIEKFGIFLSKLSTSYVKYFRYISGIIAGTMISAIAQLLKMLKEMVKTLIRKYDEMKKRTNGQDLEHLRKLHKKKDKCEELQGLIYAIGESLFKNICKRLCMDVNPDLRSYFANILCSWMNGVPSMFARFDYLYPYTQFVQDKNSKVLLKSVKALHFMYSSEHLRGKMLKFSNQYDILIHKLTVHSNMQVATLAVKIYTEILVYNPQFLQEKHFQTLHKLLYCKYRQVAQAAGCFLVKELSMNCSSSDEPSNHELLRDLAVFITKSPMHKKVFFLVDALVEGQGMMRDWDAMADLLLTEKDENKRAPSKPEVALIKLMVCCVKQVATGEVPSRCDEQVVTKSPSKKVLQRKAALTERFLKTLPDILNKFFQAPDLLFDLLKIPQYFDTKVCLETDEENLYNLLKIVYEVLTVHTDKFVFEVAIKILGKPFGKFQLPANCMSIYHKAFHYVINKFQQNLKAVCDLMENGEEIDEDGLVNACQKLSILYFHHDLERYSLWDSLMQLIKDFVQDTDLPLPEEAMVCCVSACSSALKWDRVSAENGHFDSPKRQTEAHKKRISEFMKVMMHVIGIYDYCPLVHKAYIATCDILIQYAYNTKKSKVFESMLYEPDSKLQDVLYSVCEDAVFCASDDVSSKELFKRKEVIHWFCELIVFRRVTMKMSVSFLKHYSECNVNYFPIMKKSLMDMIALQIEYCSKLILLCLISVFSDWLESNPDITKKKEELSELKKIAFSFYDCYGRSDEDSKAISELMNQGIKFALDRSEEAQDDSEATPNIDFLELLEVFNPKLNSRDKKIIINCLKQHVDSPNMSAEARQVIRKYIKCLSESQKEETQKATKKVAEKRIPSNSPGSVMSSTSGGGDDLEIIEVFSSESPLQKRSRMTSDEIDESLESEDMEVSPNQAVQNMMDSMCFDMSSANILNLSSSSE